MPKTWTTHFGSAIHGVELQWTHDPTVEAAAKSLSCRMTGNIHADLLIASSFETFDAATKYWMDSSVYNADN